MREGAARLRALLAGLLLAAPGLGACGPAETAGPPEPAAAAAAEAGETDVAAPPPRVPEARPEPAPLEAVFRSVHLDEVWSGDLNGMLRRRRIRALVVPSRTGYFLDGGTQRGVDYEALRRFEARLNEGRDHAQEVRLIVVPVTRDALIPALIQGRADLAVANLTITPERQARVAFSEPLLDGVKEILVSAPDAPPLASLEDLSGREVWVRPASSQHASLRALNRRLVARGLAPAVAREAHDHLETEDLLEMVNAGVLEHTVADDHLARFWAQVYKDMRLHEELALRSGGQIAWMFRRGSPQLKAAVDAFVATHRKGTLHGNILFKRYLRSLRWVENPLDEEHRARFDATAGLFQQHADRYGLDWLLVAAQGYQESRLDPGARSRAGAVGIMQLLPSTASSKAVGIPDIQDPGRNIHAGVKYLRWIVDRYLDDDELEEPDRTLLAMAAYNAGPSRISKLREQTAREGLDRNRWFHNVERVVAREVGREPVQYVSNVYKTWVAYRLAQERDARRDAAKRSLAR